MRSGARREKALDLRELGETMRPRKGWTLLVDRVGSTERRWWIGLHYISFHQLKTAL
jgi:hypothetical protein